MSDRNLCYICGKRMRETCVVRLFDRYPAMLFCSEEHAEFWDKSSEAAFMRWNQSLVELGVAVFKPFAEAFEKMQNKIDQRKS